MRHDVTMDRTPLGLDELVEHWTVLTDERDLVAGKRGPTRLGFALLLKFYTRHGRFPAAGPSCLTRPSSSSRGRSGSRRRTWGSTIGPGARRVPPRTRSATISASGVLGRRRRQADGLAGWPATSRTPSGTRTGSGRSCCGRCRAERIEPPAGRPDHPDRALGAAQRRSRGGSTAIAARVGPAALSAESLAPDRAGPRTRPGDEDAGDDEDAGLGAGADQVGAGEREPGVDADRDPQADTRSARSACRPGLFARRRAEGDVRVAGAGGGRVAVAPARAAGLAADDGDPAGRAAVPNGSGRSPTPWSTC